MTAQPAGLRAVLLAGWLSAVGAAAASAQVTGSPATPDSHTVYFGSWLDDASVVGRSAVWAAMSVGRAGGTVAFPVLDMAIGTTPRSQAGISVLVSHVAQGSDTTNSADQVFVYAKLLLRDASRAADRLGIAITPVVEISRSELDGSQQVSVGTPISLEVRHGGMRVYGSAGYFSRGALFESGALEISASRRFTVTGTIGHTYSTDGDPSLVSAGRHRTDFGIGVTTAMTPSVSLFGAVGRSVMSEAGAGWIAAGVSVFSKGR